MPRRIWCPLTLVIFCLPFAAPAGDWTHWRGPSQNGFFTDTGLPETFSLNPMAKDGNLVWTQPYGCRSTPVVMNNRVYLINGFGSGLEEGEQVLCLDANTGKPIWHDKFNIYHTDIVSNRVGWTSPAGDPETGNVYFHGTQGDLRAYDKDGKRLWYRNLTEEFGRVSGYGGRIVGPLCDSGLVIVGMISSTWGDFARGANRFVAFDKNTGEVVWWSPIENQILGTYYSTPVAATINGQRLLITGGADGALHAMQLRTGKQVWSHQFGGTVINGSPIVDGNFVYCSHGEENPDTNEQGRLICVDASQIANGQPKLVWEVIGTKFGYTSPTIMDGTLYIANDSGRMFGFDAKTGKPVGRKSNGELIGFGRLSRGSPVCGDGKLYIFDVNGHFHIFKVDKKGLVEIHDQVFRDPSGSGFVETNGTPAVANGKMYFGTRDAFYCIGTANGKAGETPAPTDSPSKAKPAAQLQVFPAEVVLAPAQTVSFALKAYDEDGNPVAAGEMKATWEIVTPPKTPAGLQPPPLNAELTADGKLTMNKMMPGQQGYITAKIGNMTARARVRVVPQIPYKQDFEKSPVGGTPGGWVNTTGKFEVIEKDGGKVLKKLAVSPHPSLSRANAYMGLPSYKDYVIQADVSGQMVRNGMPDIGVVNHRYHLLLDGKADPETGKRKLRISTWAAMPRINHGVDFDWKADTWYTMKLAVDADGKKAVIRGKVWERGQPEPEKWTIEFTDPLPNREGAPALYGYVSNVLDKINGSECYFDNVVITPAMGGAAPAKPADAKPDAKPASAVDDSPKARLAASIKPRDSSQTGQRSESSTPTSMKSVSSLDLKPSTATSRLADAIKPRLREDGTPYFDVAAQAMVVGGGVDLLGGGDPNARPARRYVRLNMAVRGFGFSIR